MSAPAPSSPLLKVTDLAAGYGPRHVLSGISFNAAPAAITAVIGPNGSGKSTMLKALLGLIRIHGGGIEFDGADITRQASHRRIASGMVYLPQGNRVFDELSVEENLQLGGIILPRNAVQPRIDEVLPLFPQLPPLLSRRAGTLSGGERQMVAFARALILKPRLLLLDEPSVGLSPKLVSEVLRQVVRIREETGCSVLIVEQKVEQVLTVADTVLALRMGRLEYDGPVEEARQQLKTLFL